jgi:N-methylhydantoinase A
LWPGKAHYARSVDLRYRGQGYELNLPLTKNLLRDFEKEHRRRYGYGHPNREIEIVTLRVRGVVRSATTGRGGADAVVRPGRARLGGISSLKVPVLFDGEEHETKIYSRGELSPGKKYFGPAVVTEYSATTVVPPGKRFQIDRAGNLIVNIR